MPNRSSLEEVSNPYLDHTDLKALRILFFYWGLIFALISTISVAIATGSFLIGLSIFSALVSIFTLIACCFITLEIHLIKGL